MRKAEQGSEQHGQPSSPKPAVAAYANASLVHGGYGTAVRRALFLLLALALVAGCGGGGERLTRAEYASKADAICGKYNRQTKALQNPTTLKELANVADATLPILDNAIEELRALKPPEDEQETADEWLAEVDKLRADLAEIRDKAKANDRQGVQAVVPKANEHNERSNELATRLGMTVCNEN
jgi:hypothetical protein